MITRKSLFDPRITPKTGNIAKQARKIARQIKKHIHLRIILHSDTELKDM